MRWRRWLGGAGLVVAALAVMFFGFGPGIAAGGMNRVTGDPPVISPEGAALHATLAVGDLHADSLLWNRDLLTRSTRGHADLPRLDEGNVAVQVFSAVTKSPAGQSYESNATDARDMITALMVAQLRPPRLWSSLKERALDQAARLAATAEAAPEQLRLILTADDLGALLAEREAGSRVIGGILALEGAHPLEGDLGNIAVLAGAGYRIFGITHFFDNELGGSLHGAAGADSPGLSDFGNAAVSELVARELIIDLAHASPAVARDVLDTPGARVMVSHGGIHGHCPTQRNFTDDLMQDIAAAGGIVGIGFWDEAVCGTSVDSIAEGIEAAVALLGPDAVALGSDFDGAVRTPIDASGLAAITSALLARGMDEETIAAVMGGNMMRFLAESLPRQ